MINLIKELFIKYKELVRYAICGLITTGINIVAFHIFYEVAGIALFVSNTAAWILAFIFAFISNKLWVFESKSWTGKKAISEMLGFLVARLATLVLDTFMMWLMVDVLSINGTISKVISNIITILINYWASKFIIFKNQRDV